MSAQCPFPGCNQLEGHTGPHGHHIGGGIIIAPYGGGEGKLAAKVPVDLECDVCGSPMTMQCYERGGGTFECTHTARETCTQRWTFNKDDSGSRLIIARMYPANMKEGSAMWDEYLTHTEREFLFTTRARLMCGAISEQQVHEYMSSFYRSLREARNKARAARPLWRKVWLFISRQSP